MKKRDLKYYPIIGHYGKVKKLWHLMHTKQFDMEDYLCFMSPYIYMPWKSLIEVIRQILTLFMQGMMRFNPHTTLMWHFYLPLGPIWTLIDPDMDRQTTWCRYLAVLEYQNSTV